MKKKKNVKQKKALFKKKPICKTSAVDTFPHFRRYKKAQNHPALIVGLYLDDEYKFRKVMHSERDGRHLNEKVVPNPDLTDEKPMYIGKRVKHDKKKFFGKRLSWKYSKIDYRDKKK